MNAKPDTADKKTALQFNALSLAWRGDRISATRYPNFWKTCLEFVSRLYKLYRGRGAGKVSLCVAWWAARQLSRELSFCFRLTKAAATQVERTIVLHKVHCAAAFK
jgi:hypothetical protein